MIIPSGMLRQKTWEGGFNQKNTLKPTLRTIYTQLTVDLPYGFIMVCLKIEGTQGDNSNSC